MLDVLESSTQVLKAPSTSKYKYFSNFRMASTSKYKYSGTPHERPLILTSKSGRIRGVVAHEGLTFRMCVGGGDALAEIS